MRSLILAAAVVVLLAPGITLAQEQKKEKMLSSSSNSAQAVSAKPLTVSGKVSSDGKKILTDIDSEWSVSNADALKGHEGRLVRVKCYVDTEQNSMKILSVKAEEGESSYTARHADSAFRR